MRKRRWLAGAVAFVVSVATLVVAPDGTAVLAQAPAGQGTVIAEFDDFGDLSEWQLNGRASAIPNPVDVGGTPVLRLLDGLGSQAASAFWTVPVSLDDGDRVSFSTEFRFRMSEPVNGGADGIVLLLATTPAAVGGMGGGIGYSGVDNSVGIEFDDWHNGCCDPNANHAGIGIDGEVDTVIEMPLAINLDSGAVWTAWVDYDADTETLEVRANDTGVRPVDPLLSYQVDIVEVLGQSEAYFGFTSASGYASGNFDIYSWLLQLEASNEPPVADAGDDVTVDEGTVVVLDGSGSTDPDGDALTYRWEAVSTSGPPITLSSATAVQPSFTAFDDGVYTFELTVSDGSFSATDQVTVTVGNLDPVVDLAYQGAPAGDVTLVSGSFTDPGWIDTHQVTIDWGDGSAVETSDVSAQGSGWGSFYGSHVYADAGAYDVSVTIADDDGGTDTDSASGFEVPAPVGIWTNSETASPGLAWHGSTGEIEGLVHSNSSINISGSQLSIDGPVEYVTVFNQRIWQLELSEPPTQVTPSDFPIAFDFADFAPGGPVATAVGDAYHDMTSACGSGRWHPPGQLDSGVYYVPCDVQIQGPQLGGRTTIVADGKIAVFGRRAVFDPYYDGLLFLSNSTDATKAIQFSDAAGKFLGVLYAPRGGIQMSSSSARLFCGILADKLRISGAFTTIRGADCGRPEATVAPPLLVPNLSVDLTVNADNALPGDALDYEMSVSNDGSLLVVPAVVGLENVDETAATVGGYSYAIEYYSIADDEWLPLASTSATSGGYTLRDPLAGGEPLSLSVKPNPASEVAYGAEPIVDTVIEPGGYATWGTQALIELTPELVELILDPALTGGVRNRVEIEFVDPGTQARPLYRRGSDFAGALQSQSGSITDAEVTVTLPSGDPVVLTSAALPGLAELAPGDSLATTLPHTVALPAERNPLESDAEYLARLAALDGTPLVGAASASGSVSLGTLFAPQALAVAAYSLPVVGLDVAGPATIDAGAGAEWGLDVGNTGLADATSVSVAFDIAGVGSIPVTDAPAALAAGEAVSASAAYDVPGSQLDDLFTTATVEWVDANGNSYGPIASAGYTEVISPLQIVAHKTGEGLTEGVSAVIVVYDVVITNTGDQAATDVAFADTVDPNVALAPEATTVVGGTVTSGGATDTLTVDFGTLDPGETVSVGYTTGAASIPLGVTTLTNQGIVSSNELPDVLTDDPSEPGVADPTVVSPYGVAGGGGGTTIPDGDWEVPDVAPAEGTVVTEPVAVTTGVIEPPNGATVESWVVLAYPEDGSSVDALVLGAGTGAVPDEPALFDPTLVHNGGWAIRVEVTDSDGGLGVGESSVIVEGWLKLGRYTTTYQDMAVGVGGMPLQVLRTYDTVERFESGDFGYGWSVDVADFRVSTNGPLGADGWSEVPCGGGLVFTTLCYTSSTPHYVTVTWPDGLVETFDLTPLEGSTFFSGLTEADFTARPGSTSSLAAPDDALFYLGGSLYGGSFGSGGVYDPDVFVLTDRFGTEYTLQVGVGLLEVEDRSGNTLTFSEAGVVSSFGEGIDFVRDGDGRITSIVGPDGSTVGYEYDANGDLEYVTDQNGNRTELTYLAGHYLDEVVDPLGRPFRTLEYDEEGRLAAIVDAEGNRTEIATDVDGRQQVVTDAVGLLTTVATFDERGNLVQEDEVFDGQTLTTTFQYGELDLEVLRIDALGNEWVSEYDDAGNLTRTVDPLGNETVTTYDSLGLVTSIVDAEGGVTGFSYDAAGRVIDWTDRTGSSWSFEYDPRGSIERVVNPLGEVREITVDPQGRLASVTDSLDRVTTYGVDGMGHLVSVTDPLGNTTAVAYDAAGRLTHAIDAMGRVAEYVYDDADQLVAMVDALSGEVTFGYDAAGRLISVTDAVGSTRLRSYDGVGRLTAETDALGRATVYGYDGKGRLTERTDARGETIFYDYDELDRLVGEASADGTVTVGYDPAGRRVTMDDPSGTTTWAYDAAGRVTGVVSPRGEVGYGYDAEGRRTELTLPVGVVTYGHDAAGRLASITDWGGRSATYGYDAAGQMTSIVLPGGVDSTLSYDGAGRVTGIEHAGPAGVLESYEYEYDAVGNRVMATGSGGVESYTLDELYRLTGVTYGGGDSVSYSYDAAGNRTSETVGGVPVVSVFDAAGQVASVDGVAWDYDEAGNVVLDGPRGFGWDAHGRLASVSDGSSSTAYGYDGEGLRVATVDAGGVSELLWDRLAEYPLVVSDGESWFVHGPGFVIEDGPLGVEVVLADVMGSARVITDGSGTVVGSASYDVFGEVRVSGGVGSLFGFTGEVTDSSGLVYLRARVLDPGSGRFLSVDPLQPNHPGTQGWNRYGYVAGNPTTYVDPGGYGPLFEEFTLESAVSGGLLGLSAGAARAILACEDDDTFCQVNSIISGTVVGFVSGGFASTIAADMGCVFGSIAAVLEDFGARAIMGVEAPDAGDVAVDLLVGCLVGGGGASMGGPPPVPVGVGG